MKKNRKAYEAALSAVACSVAVAFLWLGILSGVLTALGYFVGVIALMMPLSEKFYLGGFLAYVGTCILTLLLGAVAQFWDLVPFIMFFGLHPLANSLQRKYKINGILAFIIKAIWFDCTLIAGYFLVFGGILGGKNLPAEFYEIVNKYIYLFIFTLGTAAFALYDFLIFRCQAIMDRLVYRITR